MLPPGHSVCWLLVVHAGQATTAWPEAALPQLAQRSPVEIRTDRHGEETWQETQTENSFGSNPVFTTLAATCLF